VSPQKQSVKLVGLSKGDRGISISKTNATIGMNETQECDEVTNDKDDSVKIIHHLEA